MLSLKGNVPIGKGSLEREIVGVHESHHVEIDKLSNMYVRKTHTPIAVLDWR